MKTILAIIALPIFAWVAYRYFSTTVKEPKFSLREIRSGYEIRTYSSSIEARVVVSGTYREAMNSGFRILAGYIFGGNTSKQSIAMTAPVTEQKSEAIAMTAPVTESEVEGGERVVAFAMPGGYTLATLPTPNDARIEIVEVPAHTTAVLRYSGHSDAETVVQMKAKLLAYLQRDEVRIVGVPRSAGYNPPWTPSLMRRNEILVDIN